MKETIFPSKVYKDRKEIYTDKFGNKYYQVNVGNIPAERALYAWIYSNDIQFGLTVEKRQALRDKRRIAINAEPVDKVTLGSLLEIEEAAEKLYSHPDILLNLATVYFLKNDEEPESYLDYIQEEKLNIWKRDHEARSFFLQQSYLTISKYLSLPERNVQEYLKEVKPVLDLISRTLKTR